MSHPKTKVISYQSDVKINVLDWFSAFYGVGTVVGNYLVGIVRDITGDFLIIYLIICVTLLAGTVLSLKLPAD